MKTKNVVLCEHCQAEIPLERDMTEGFCLRCGSPFHIEGNKDMDRTLEQALDLFKKSAWAQLAAYTDQCTDERLVLLHQAAKVHLLFDNYIDAAHELAIQTAPKGFLRFLTGHSAYGEDPMHSAFFEQVSLSAEKIGEWMREHAIDIKLKERVSASVTDCLIRLDKQPGTPTYWSLAAVEQQVLPVLPYLALDALMQRYEAYKKVNPDNQSLPNQMAVKKEMERIILEKGGKITQRSSIFGRRQRGGSF